jgi:hypothetical protein
MIRPSIEDLLQGVTDSLHETVLPELPPGAARKQVQAAIRVIRRAAHASDRVGPYLYADNQDIEATLRAILPLSGDVEDRLRASLTQAVSSEAYPSPSELAARNEALQTALAELQDALPEMAARSKIEALLRALFRRMLERERGLTPPQR